MSAEKQNSKDPLIGREACRYSEVSMSEHSDDVVFDISLENRRRRMSRVQKLAPTFLHIFIIVLYTAIFAVSYSKLGNDAADVDELGIPYVQKVFEVNPALNESVARIYTGEPSEELDAAWERLLQYSNIRIPEDEIRRLDRLEESVRFTDGSGYFGQMTVFHHLHCIMRVHHFLHVEHYWPNATADDLYLLRAHNFHCLDTLRQAIQCQGDTSLLTFRWGTSQPIPLGNFTSEHRCKDWSALDAWNEERFVDVFQPGLVVHPKFGPAYEGEGTHGTGVVVENRAAGAHAGAHQKGADDKVEAEKTKERIEGAWSRREEKRKTTTEVKGKKGRGLSNKSRKRESTDDRQAEEFSVEE